MKTLIDPVCGMTVDESALRVEGYDDVAFCAPGCRTVSDETREQFARAFFQRIIVRDKRVVSVTLNLPFESIVESSTKTRSRRRTGIEPARELSPPRRF